MGALSDLLKRPQAAATLATIATRPAAGVRLACRNEAVSQESQESQEGAPEMRAHLLSLASDEGVDAAHVHRLHAEDVAACCGESDDLLRAYLRVLKRGTEMDAGIVPPSYTHGAHCERCGPVWLSASFPHVVKSCPWCFRRRAGRSFPRPLVQCGECRHYRPDPLNPAGGWGSCEVNASAATWPMRPHACAGMRPIDNNEKQGDPLMLSQSVEVRP